VTRIELWNGDICDLEVDAIVSPATPSLWMSSGTAGELKRAGGDEIEFAAVRQGPVAVGEAVVTPAGRLAAKVVVHAVSIERNHRTSAEAIDRAARSAIACVRELGLASVAIPALGTGVGGFPLAEAAQVAVGAVREELQTPSSIEHVVFALRGAAAYQAFADALSAAEPAPSRPLVAATAWQAVGPGPGGDAEPSEEAPVAAGDGEPSEEAPVAAGVPASGDPKPATGEGAT